MFATNSLFCSGGITQPFTFQGLSSFFLTRCLLLHTICFPRNSIPPFYLPANVRTIWQNPLVAHYSKAKLTLPPYRHLLLFRTCGLLHDAPKLLQNHPL